MCWFVCIIHSHTLIFSCTRRYTCLYLRWRLTEVFIHKNFLEIDQELNTWKSILGLTNISFFVVILLDDRNIQQSKLSLHFFVSPTDNGECHPLWLLEEVSWVIFLVFLHSFPGVNSTLVKSQVAEKKNGKRMQKSYYLQMNERQNGSRDRYIDLKKKSTMRLSLLTRHLIKHLVVAP